METRRINAPVVIFILGPQRLREFSLFENHAKVTGLGNVNENTKAQNKSHNRTWKENQQTNFTKVHEKQHTARKINFIAT